MIENVAFRGIKTLKNEDIDSFVKAAGYDSIDELFLKNPVSFEARAIATILLQDEHINNITEYSDSWGSSISEDDDGFLYED